MNKVRITCGPASEPGVLERYGAVSIAFWVRSRLVIPVDDSLLLLEEAVDKPYLKDYDAVAGEGPARWRKRFDISTWIVLQADIDDILVGGAVLIPNEVGGNVDDTVILHDLRVHPAYRGKGIGSRLFAEAETWARAHGYREFMIETQNINVPACRFYHAQGCELRTIDTEAYSEFPDEAQMLWYKSL